MTTKTPTPITYPEPVERALPMGIDLTTDQMLELARCIADGHGTDLALALLDQVGIGHPDYAEVGRALIDRAHKTRAKATRRSAKWRDECCGTSRALRHRPDCPHREEA